MNPSDKTQVPSFFTIQSSISRSRSCSSVLHRVTIVLTRSSKSFTCWNKVIYFLFSQTKHVRLSTLHINWIVCFFVLTSNSLKVIPLM